MKSPLLLLLALFPLASIAQTPVDIYQDMESGHDGDLLTPAIMNASSRGGGCTWSITGKMWVSTKNIAPLPGPLTLGGATFRGADATRSWVFNDNNQLNYVKCTLPGRYAKLTVACYYTTGVTIPWIQFDSINHQEHPQHQNHPGNESAPIASILRISEINRDGLYKCESL